MNIKDHLNSVEIIDLCEKIGMPLPATQAVIDIIPSIDWCLFAPYAHKLLDITTAPPAYKTIDALLLNNPSKGKIWLAISLACALATFERYNKMNIDKSVFFATMCCFSRFVKEHFDSFGTYDFDRAFWSYRQLSQTIYRIGELEFEMVKYELDDIVKNGSVALKKGENILSVHIPSDGKIDKTSCLQSYKLAIDFFKKHYPLFDYTMLYCESWLMSPNLSKVLPATSNILAFQGLYELCNEFPDDMSYVMWVYKDERLTPSSFPELTSLQRNIKQYALSGKKLGAGDGIINKNSI